MNLNYNCGSFEVIARQRTPRKSANISGLLHDFAVSKKDVSQICWEDDYKTVESARASISEYIKRNCLNNFRLMVRNKKLYIYRVDHHETT